MNDESSHAPETHGSRTLSDQLTGCRTGCRPLLVELVLVVSIGVTAATIVRHGVPPIARWFGAERPDQIGYLASFATAVLAGLFAPRFLKSIMARWRRS